MKEDNQQMSAEANFRSGNSCFKRGLYDVAEKLFREG